MTAQEKLYTADDLWELSHREEEDESRRYELDEGELTVMTPTGDTHGLIANWIAFRITGYVAEHDLGEVTAAETGFVLHKDPHTGRETVRASDVGFIAKSRVPPMTGKYYQVAPDLAVEVVSPTDTARYIRRKVMQFLRAGTRLIWVVYPDEKDRFVDVYRPNRPIDTFQVGDSLDGGDVLAGFNLPVADVFSRLRSSSPAAKESDEKDS